MPFQRGDIVTADFLSRTTSSLAVVVSTPTAKYDGYRIMGENFIIPVDDENLVLARSRPSDSKISARQLSKDYEELTALLKKAQSEMTDAEVAALFSQRKTPTE